MTPGVYLMRDRAGTIIYIGKAKSLKNRVPTYFRSLRGQAVKVWRMVEMVYDFEYILTDTELEALILENQLIKKHRPRYNIRLKDDKTYPYIKVTVQEEWPRVIGTRLVDKKDGARYFGPYPGKGTVDDIIDILDKLFPFRTCDLLITGKEPRPCVQYFIHRCLGPCASLADKDAYSEAIRQVVLFLDGKHDTIAKSIRKEMEEAAENLQFERAAVFRDRLRLVDRVVEQQKVFRTTNTDQDVIAFARNDGEACVQVFFIREGKLIGRENFVLEGSADSTPGEIVGGFLGQFYYDATDVPPKVLLQHDISDAEVIEAWLREKRGHKVTLAVPRRGEKRDLVELAARNAAETLEQMRITWLSDEQKGTAGLTELQKALNLPSWPGRIECYDVAHLQGVDTAGAMVVFENGQRKNKEYRRFSIKTSGNDDFASMREMLTRRFRRSGIERSDTEREQALNRARSGERGEHAPGAEAEAVAKISSDLSEELSSPELGDTVEDLANKGHFAAQGDENVQAYGNGNGQATGGWAVLPDLVVIDGGKGQLAVAVSVLNECGLADIPAVGLAKKEEEIFFPGQSQPLILDRRSEALKLLQRIRDEAHRYSNNYNKKLGAKRATKSKLDQVPHIGPVRKKALLKEFGTLDAMRGATVEALATVKGMDRAAALSIKEHL